MDGIKKTALFLSGLEWKTVDLLLGRLDPESARAVRREMMSLGSSQAGETDRIAHEFLEATGRKRHPKVAPIEHRIDCRSGTYLPASTRSRVSRFPVESKSRPFDFLRESEAESIVRELTGERAQTVAVVLAHLPASLAGEVLGMLPAARQAEVTRRLSEFDSMDEQVLRDIETALRNRFEHRMRTESRSRRGTTVMKEILRASDPATQALILANLRHYDDSADSESSDRHVSFDDLERLGNSDLSTLFHSVDSMTAMLALVGAKPSLIERVTKRFSPTEEYQMRQQLKRLGMIERHDVDRARDAILQKAEKLLGG